MCYQAKTEQVYESACIKLTFPTYGRSYETQLITFQELI